jgi:HEAT repeat protein/cyclophilin family peptidyl-prolyl cis-trans isomerase
MIRRLVVVPALACVVSFAAVSSAGAQTRRPLASADVDNIARLLMLEDQRTYDDTLLTRLIASPHPEIRRRAALTIARLADKRGMPLLRTRLTDADTAVVATAVFAIGQIRDTTLNAETVALLDSLLSSPRLAPTALVEAAGGLGKARGTVAREALSAFLSRATADARTRGAVAEALLSIGRHTMRGDNAAIVKWTNSPDEDLRWRATWALFRPRDPAAVARLIEMSKDRSALVRSWAVRGLTRAQADSASLGAQAKAMLIAAASDEDRRVKTEAIRALFTYTDSASLAVLSSALQSDDSWVAVSAAEGLGVIRNPSSIPLLKQATAADRPCAVRAVALNSLRLIAPAQVVPSALAVLQDTVPYCRTQAMAVLNGTLAATGAAAPDAATRDAINVALASMRASRRADLKSTDPLVVIAALKAINTWGDTTDIDAIRPLTARTPHAVGHLAVTAIDAIVRRRDAANQPGGGGRGGGRGGRPNTAAGRTLADYRQIAERWVVPDYEGKPRPTSTWTTPKGEFVIELYPGEAPIATDDFVRTMDAGAMIGTQFTRVVPDFVNQQEGIRSNLLRDEVSRRRIERTNLSWASAGLDTGNPGYTLNHTPQPHNEGNFTTLGHVIRGMDVVDRTDVGDRILSARMNR